MVKWTEDEVSSEVDGAECGVDCRSDMKKEVCVCVWVLQSS